VIKNIYSHTNWVARDEKVAFISQLAVIKNTRNMNAIIKISILVILFALIASETNAQKCKNEKDPFTGMEKKEFVWKHYAIPFLKLEKDTSGLVIMTYRHAQPYVVDYTIPSGSKFLIKLKNDQIIELFTVEDARTRTGASSSTYSGTGGGTTYSECYMIFHLTHAQLTTLAKYPAISVRHPNFDGKDFDAPKVAKKFANMLMQGAQCML